MREKKEKDPRLNIAPRKSTPPPQPILPAPGSGATALHGPSLHSVEVQRGHPKAALTSRAKRRRGQQLSGGETLRRQLDPTFRAVSQRGAAGGGGTEDGYGVIWGARRAVGKAETLKLATS